MLRLLPAAQIEIHKVKFCLSQISSCLLTCVLLLPACTRHDFRRQKLDQQRTMFTTTPIPSTSTERPFVDPLRCSDFSATGKQRSLDLYTVRSLAARQLTRYS